MLNQYAVDHPTCPLFRDLGGSLSRLVGMLSRNDKRPDIWDTHGISGNVFCKSTGSSSSPYSGGFNPWTSVTSERTSPHVTSELQTPDTTLDPRFQPGPSARNSCDPEEGRFFKGLWSRPTKTADFGSELHIDKFLTPTTFAFWKIRFKTEVCTCSQFPTEAVLWVKEVEMVDSVDDFKSSLSARGIRMPDFEVFDAKIASALNRNHP